MFIGRERELNALERLYQSNKFEFAVIYGRRRVGKTALINKFIDDKNAIYFRDTDGKWYYQIHRGKTYHSYY